MLPLLLLSLPLVQDARPTHLGTWERTLHGLDRPEAVAIDGTGRLWVAEAGASRVRAFDRAGAEVARFEAGLVEPVDLCGTPWGVLVADRGARSVLAVRGTGDGEILGSVEGLPTAVVLQQSMVLAGLEQPSELKALGAYLAGAFVPASAQRSSTATAHESVSDLASLPGGDLLVLDALHHQLRRHDSEGTLVTSTGGFGFFESLFASPGGLDVADGRVFVADTENHRVQVFDLARLVRRDGPALPVPPLYTFGQHALRPREGKGSLHYPADVAVADDRSWGAVAEPWVDRVQVFGRGDGARPPRDPSRIGIEQASPHYGRRVAIDGTLMTIVVPETQQVEVFDLRQFSEERRNDPLKLSNFGGLGERLGMFRMPEGMDLRLADRSLYVCDAGSRQLVHVVLDVDPEADPEQDFEMARFVRRLQLNERPLAVDRAGGEVFVLLQSSGVLVLDEETLMARGALAPGLDRPTDLAVSPDGQRLYVACAEGVRLVPRDGSSTSLLGADALDEPFGVALTPTGDLVVTDSGAHQVLVLSPTGEVRQRWGEKGLQRGRLYRPAGVALDGEGMLYVIDHANHRGVITDLAGEFLHAFGSRSYTRPANRPETYKAEDYEE